MKKKGNEGEQQVLAELALLGEVILDQRQAELKGNQDVNLITDSAVLGINETNKIRELFHALCEILDTEKERGGNEARSCERMESNGGNLRSE